MWEKSTNGFFQTFIAPCQEQPKLLAGIGPVFDLSAFDTADDKRGRAIHIAPNAEFEFGARKVR